MHNPLKTGTMKKSFTQWIFVLTFALTIVVFCSFAARAQLAGAPSADDLVIARDGKTLATIVVAPDAGKLEQQAAADLAIYIG